MNREATTEGEAAAGFGRGMVLLALANAVYIVTAYGVTTVTARLLEPVEFGDFGVVMAWITLLTALLVKGMATSISREMAIGQVDEATAWRAGVGLGVRMSVALAVVGAALSPLAARAFGTPDAGVQLAVGALGALTFGLNAVLLAWPTGMRQYGRQALAQVAYAVARVALVVGGAAAFGIDGAVVGYVLAPLLAAAPIAGRHPAATSSLGPVRARMLRAVVPVALVSLATAAYFVIDVFALSAAVGDRSVQVGVYVAYGTIAHVPFFLLQAASVAIVPTLAATRSRVARTDAIRRTTTDTLVLLAGPTLILATAGDAASRVVFGVEYHTDASVVLPLALATGAVTILANLVAIDVAIGRLRMSLAVAGVGAVVLGAAASWAARLDAGTPAGNVAWAAMAVSVVAALVLALDLRARHGSILEARRTGLGLMVAALAAMPPLAFGSDRVRLVVAALCGVAWVVVVIRLRLVDLRRAPPAEVVVP
ncbi:MAG: hypothetical protein JWM98_2333 [Thermoleophilia bacterium]|nr:hypothetical protein [Thermoleophilia bacterium]